MVTAEDALNGLSRVIRQDLPDLMHISSGPEARSLIGNLTGALEDMESLS